MPSAAPGRGSAAVISMALTMRPTGLGSGFYKDNADYGIYCGEWCIGRIYETRTGPEYLRWFWALHAPSKPGACEPPTRRRRWTRPRPSSRRAGSSGRRGRGWRRGHKGGRLAGVAMKRPPPQDPSKPAAPSAGASGYTSGWMY